MVVSSDKTPTYKVGWVGVETHEGLPQKNFRPRAAVHGQLDMTRLAIKSFNEQTVSADQKIFYFTDLLITGDSGI